VKAVNVEATRKRTKRHRRQWQSAHDQAVRAEAFARAGNRCEWQWFDGRDFHQCDAREGLHAHHLRYPKTRALVADDLQVLCARHHAAVESRDFSYRRHGRIA
jgi:hypothetical protein